LRILQPLLASRAQTFLARLSSAMSEFGLEPTVLAGGASVKKVLAR
jgi:hypothetical protein